MRSEEKEVIIELDSKIITYFVKLSLKNRVDYKVLIKQALEFIIEKKMKQDLAEKVCRTFMTWMKILNYSIKIDGE